MLYIRIVRITVFFNSEWHFLKPEKTLFYGFVKILTRIEGLFRYLAVLGIGELGNFLFFGIVGGFFGSVFFFWKNKTQGC